MGFSLFSGQDSLDTGLRVSERHGLQETGGDWMKETGLFQISSPVGKMSVCDPGQETQRPCGKT